MATKNRKYFIVKFYITRKPKQGYRARGISRAVMVTARNEQEVEDWVKGSVLNDVKNENESPEELYVKTLKVERLKLDGFKDLTVS